MRKHVYRAGDEVRILRSHFIRRVGYPLHYKELACEARDLVEEKVLWEVLGLKRYNKDLVYAVAKLLVEERGFGGNERSIHYFNVVEPRPSSSLTDFASLAVEEDPYQIDNHMTDQTGSTTVVQSKYVVRTGTRVPGSGYSTDYGWEWEDGYLDKVKSHVILRTDLGDIEVCDVELVRPAS